MTKTDLRYHFGAQKSCGECTKGCPRLLGPAGGGSLWAAYRFLQLTIA
jgi:hypothetical protein